MPAYQHRLHTLDRSFIFPSRAHNRARRPLEWIEMIFEKE